MFGTGLEDRGSAECLHTIGAYRRSRRRRLHARGDDRGYRCHRAPRRQKSDRAGAQGGTGTGDRASRRGVSCVRRPKRESRDGAGHRAERQDAPYRCLRRGGDFAGGPRLCPHAPRSSDQDAARGRLRGSRRRGGRALHRAREDRNRAGLVHGVSGRHHRGARGR